ncbi:putative Diguanylate cyclase [uncultured Desulfobacterium sp.]|uniref:diguanylate cyclase n=1 Tax=uncultured Desulfobacterium sp. TaxID=201089 RepID=A0A445N2J3_9BACT|nr:putative Diguanylate cyclase [uncultured Desulfobacterium sp.]
MNQKETALWELIDKMEQQLSQFQDKMDISQIWEIFLDDIKNLINIEFSALFLENENTHEFILHQVTPSARKDICKEEQLLQIECGMFASIIKRRRPGLVPSLAYKGNKKLMLFILPFSTVKRTRGVAFLFTQIEESSLTKEDDRHMEISTKLCSLVIDNTLLYEEKKSLSITDSLTGSYNRTYLIEHLPQEIKRATRYGRPLSLVLCDIDHFKNINDKYGHQIGDRVLREFVQCLTDLIRSDLDWLARYGGEEFLLVLPETDVKSAVSQAERLRKNLSKRVIETPENRLHITASFGVTGFSPVSPEDKIHYEALINCADKYMYQAKHEGRNRVIGGPFAAQI